MFPPPPFPPRFFGYFFPRFLAVPEAQVGIAISAIAPSRVPSHASWILEMSVHPGSIKEGLENSSQLHYGSWRCASPNPRGVAADEATPVNKLVQTQHIGGKHCRSDPNGLPACDVDAVYLARL
jgi:hypothetical protein